MAVSLGAALDGVASGEQRVVFMTTNFIERLDPALIRPGRVDMVHLVDFAETGQMAELFARFYPELEEDSPMPAHFAAAVERSGLDVSMAELQGHLLRHKGEPLLALENVPELAAEATARQQTSRWNERAEASPEPSDGDGEEEEPRGRRRLRGSDVDRVVFNPQEGWEETVGKIVGRR